ncbi:MAG: hypothetical protein ACRDLU_03095 [Gaiellaceae bacterium]
MRSVLAGHLNPKPEELTFVYGPQGKPELESDGRRPRVRLLG